MKERDLMKELEKLAIFGLNDIIKIKNSSREYSKIVLNRLLERKLVSRIARNIYTTKSNILVIASNIKFPSYVSFWSASSYQGFTEQILSTIYVASTRKLKEVIFEGYKIKFIKLNDFFGYQKIRTEDGEIFLVDPEKLLIDCFLSYKSMGNFDEIKKVFSKSEISLDKLVKYLKKIKSQTLIKRVGCLLEIERNLDISKKFILDNNYILLNPFSKKYKEINSKWRVKL